MLCMRVCLAFRNFVHRILFYTRKSTGFLLCCWKSIVCQLKSNKEKHGLKKFTTHMHQTTANQWMWMTFVSWEKLKKKKYSLIDYRMEILLNYFQFNAGDDIWHFHLVWMFISRKMQKITMKVQKIQPFFRKARYAVCMNIAWEMQNHK